MSIEFKDNFYANNAKINNSSTYNKTFRKSHNFNLNYSTPKNFNIKILPKI